MDDLNTALVRAVRTNLPDCESLILKKTENDSVVNVEILPELIHMDLHQNIKFGLSQNLAHSAEDFPFGTLNIYLDKIWREISL